MNTRQTHRRIAGATFRRYDGMSVQKSMQQNINLI